jgi:biotin transporter BioY
MAGLLSAVALALLIAAPATVLADNWSMIGISIVAAEIVVLLGGMTWLALLVSSDKA